MQEGGRTEVQIPSRLGVRFDVRLAKCIEARHVEIDGIVYSASMSKLDNLMRDHDANTQAPHNYRAIGGVKRESLRCMRMERFVLALDIAIALQEKTSKFRGA